MSISRSRYIILFFLIQLLGCLGWLCDIAVAQVDLAESVTGSLNSPDIAIAFIGNLAVFVTSLLRGRLDLEIGARDVLATMRVPGLKDPYEINAWFGLTTCEESPEPENRFAKASVLMLSFDEPITSMRQFMKYFLEAYKVHSILLQCFPLKSQSAKPTEAAELLPGICNCKLDHDQDGKSPCNCIVFWNVQEIVSVLVHRMPGKLKRLSDSLCLLPCPECMKTGCHGCKQDQLDMEDEYGRKKLSNDDINKGNKAVHDIFEYISRGDMNAAHSCICIPLSPGGYDYWTKMLMRSLGYTYDRSFSIDPSFTVPRLTEVLLNFVLTGWFRVDGFSSALVARRAIREYVVQGGGFAANAFLARASHQNNYDCSVLTFRGGLSGIGTFSFMIGCANLICFISWVVLVSSQGWYDSRANPPSKLAVVTIMVTIGIALGMDCLHLYVRGSRQLEEPRSLEEPREPRSLEEFRGRKVVRAAIRKVVRAAIGCPEWEEFRRRKVVRAAIILEIMCILFGIIIIPILGIKVVGRWFYGALQVLVGLKWFIGSYLLGDYPSEYDHHFHYHFDNGILVYSSAFLLNCVLAGVRCNWTYSISPI